MLTVKYMWKCGMMYIINDFEFSETNKNVWYKGRADQM